MTEYIFIRHFLCREVAFQSSLFKTQLSILRIPSFNYDFHEKSGLDNKHDFKFLCSL